jgi:hypothetical protein
MMGRIGVVEIVLAFAMALTPAPAYLKTAAMAYIAGVF